MKNPTMKYYAEQSPRGFANEMKTITVSGKSVRLVRHVSCGLRDHDRGGPGRHSLAYGVDANGRYYRTNSASRWVRCMLPHLVEQARQHLERE